jgi:hypothetical protein
MNWRDAGSWLAENGGPHHPLLLTNSIQIFPMQHYLHQIGAPVPIEVHETSHRMRRRLAEIPGAIIATDQWAILSEEWNWLEDLPSPARRFHGLSLHIWQNDAGQLAQTLDDLAERAAPQFEADGRRFELESEILTGLGTGWWMAEGEEDGIQFRWMASARAGLHLPIVTPQHTRLTFRASAYSWPGASSQHLQVKINGTEVGQGTVEIGWATFAITVPADVWRRGANAVELVASRVTAPATVTDSGDRRPLAVAVDWVSLGDEGEPDHDWTGTAPLDAHPALLAEAAHRFTEEGLMLDVGAEPFAAVTDESWHPFELWDGDFTMRWSRIRRAEIEIPLEAPGDWDLRFRAIAFSWGDAPSQRTIVSVNGAPVGEGVLGQAWEVHHIPISGGPWRAGLNSIAFETDHVASPADTGGPPDHRPLGMGLDWVELASPGPISSEADHVWESRSQASSTDSDGTED